MRPGTEKEEITGDVDFSATDIMVTADEDTCLCGCVSVCVW